MIVQVISAFFAILAFSVVNNVPKKFLLYCGLEGSVGWFVYLIFLPAQGAVMANFFGSLALAIMAHVFARVFKAPVTVFLIPGLLILVPGAGLFRSAYQLFLGTKIWRLFICSRLWRSPGMIALAVFVVDSVFSVINKKRRDLEELHAEKKIKKEGKVMNGKVKAFLKRKDVVFSASRYGIDALGAMAQGLFASLLIGTILSTLGEQLGIAVLVTIGGYAKAATGPAMAVAIGYALKTPQLVLFSLIAVGAAANELGKAGGPLAVLVVAIVASECGKIVSKETKIDIIVTPAVTISIGVLLSLACAPAIGKAASSVGNAIMWATEAVLYGHPRVSVLVGVL